MIAQVIISCAMLFYPCGEGYGKWLTAHVLVIVGKQWKHPLICVKVLNSEIRRLFMHDCR